MREVSTSEALMTDPTTPEGAAYWQQRRELEEALERMEWPLPLPEPRPRDFGQVYEIEEEVTPNEMP